MAVIDVPDRMTLTAPAPDAIATAGVQTVGHRGLGVHYYWLVTHFPIGVVVSEPFPVWDAPIPMNASNYVLIVWTRSAGATSYDLLRTETPNLPNTAGNFALATGLTVTEFEDQGQALSNYDLTGLPRGAPVSCLVHLNNRDYASPVMEMPCAMKVSTLLFPDGTTQTTAGGAAIKIKGSVPTHGDLPATGNDEGDAYIVLSPAPPHMWVWDGSTWIDAGPAASISAAGSNGQIQYNDGGLFAASPNLAWEIMWGATVPTLRSNGLNVVDVNPNEGVQVWYDSAIHNGQGGIYAFDFNAQVYKQFLLDGNPLILNGDLNSGAPVIIGQGALTPVTNSAMDAALVVINADRGIDSLRASDDVNWAALFLGKSRGSVATPTPVQVGDGLGYIGMGGKTQTAPNGWGVNGAEITCVVTAVNPSGIAAHLSFATNDGTPNQELAIERMRITSQGDVGIGTLPPQHRLDVNGDINCTGNYRVNGVAMAFGGASVSTTAPATPVEGQFWYDPSALRLFVRAGGAWFQV